MARIHAVACDGGGVRAVRFGGRWWWRVVSGTIGAMRIDRATMTLYAARRVCARTNMKVVSWGAPFHGDGMYLTRAVLP